MKMRTAAVVTLVGASFAGVWFCGGLGCGTGTSMAPGDVVAAPGGSTLTGKISFSGTAPKATKIQMAADPVCIKNHPGDAFTESVVVNGNGTLKNVFVYIKSVPGTFAPPAAPMTIDQKGCAYAPHVFGIQTGQKLKILNSDGTLHNVHWLSKINPSQNLAMPKFVKEKETAFAKEEVMVKFQCEVHNWMNAWMGVLPHPFFAVSGAEGTYTIKDLPAGTYDVIAWHEKYGTQTMKVTVSGSDSKTADFAFKAS